MKLSEKERIDKIGFGGYVVIQKASFGYGVDSVLLADFVSRICESANLCNISKTIKVEKEKYIKIADLGTGSGIIPFILAHKIYNSKITGIEVRKNAYENALRACEMNGLKERVNFVNMDIKSYKADLAFDVVVSNPPYFKASASIPSTDRDRLIARHETSADIYDFCNKASELLVKGGHFFIVHRPDRLADIFDAVRKSKMEVKTVQPIIPMPGKSANIILIHAIKNAGAGIKWMPEIAVHNKDNNYTEEILKIYER